MKLFNLDSPLMTFLSRIGDLVILNALWLICCIPVVTIGPSTTAMNAVAHQLVLDECPGVIKSFFRFFKRDFRQSLILGLIFIVCGVLAFLELTILKSGEFPFFLTLVCYLPPLVLCFIFSYAFPLLAHYDNTIFQTIKNSLLLSIGNLPRTLLICFLDLVPLIFCMAWTTVFLYTFPIWLTLGCSTLCFLTHLLFKPLFEKLDERSAEGD